jgi:hypothetical protein
MDDKDEEKPVLRPPGGFGLLKGTRALNPGGRPITNWRGWLRKNTKNGAEIHEILLEIARGQPKTVTLLDGKQATIVPTAEVRARVAIHLDEMLHGKAVTQNEQQRAEREASALQAVQALSDQALEERVKAALLRAPEALQLEEGELIPVSAREIWQGNTEE